MSNQLPVSLFAFIRHFLKPVPWALVGIIGLALISGIYGFGNAYLTKVLIDIVSAIGNQPVDLFGALWLPALLFLLNYEIHNLSWRGIQYIKLKAGPRVQCHIIRETFAYVEKHAYRYFQDNFSGSIASNIYTLSDNIFTILTDISPFLFRQTMQLCIALISMYLVNPYFGVTFFLWLLVFLCVSFLFTNKLMTLSDVLAESQAKLAGKITDSISNANTVRLFSRESFEVQYLSEYLSKFAMRYRQKEWFVLKLSMAQSFSITLLIAVLLYTLIKLRMAQLVTIGDFAFILGLALYVTEGTWYLVESIIRLNDQIGRAKQCINMLIVPQEVIDKPDAQSIVINKGHIAFEEVAFQYKDNASLFENKSVTIPGGQKVGLVGFSGSGKTTFVNLIVRLFDVTSGVIRIDQQDISTVTQASLREQIGLIPQDPILFHRTLMENIRYGNINATDEAVIAASKKAHAHEFILLTPKGYESLVGERGIKLSGGQRQRISIARAILKNAPILILDEATSALDSVTEGYIQESLTALMQGKTVIVVAHRLSTLMEMDRILVFDQGKIVEDGTHQSLMSQGGMYATLWNSQVGGFLLDE